MRKKFLECGMHSLTLFKCKRRCWQKGGKDKIWASDYTEKCFKCIAESKYIKKETVKEKVKHFKI